MVFLYFDHKVTKTQIQLFIIFNNKQFFCQTVSIESALSEFYKKTELNKSKLENYHYENYYYF